MEVIKKDLKEIEEKIDINAKTSKENADKILETIKKLHEHDEQIKKNSFAVEILRDYKNVNKIFLMFAVVGWVFAILCLVILLVK